MDGPLDEQYLIWLYSHISPLKLKNPSRTHWALARQLYSKEFVWLVPNDDNRVEDGKSLRREFIQNYEVEINEEWLNMGCSMLEMLIALSRRLSFEAEGEPRAWFWHLIQTLDLEQYNDKHYDDDARKVIDETLERVIWRRYEPNGEGGLFPLRNPRQDQREVEIWYQLSAYLVELF